MKNWKCKCKHRIIFLKKLSNLCTQCGTYTHDPEIKSWTLDQLTHPGAPNFLNYRKLISKLHKNKCVLSKKTQN